MALEFKHLEFLKTEKVPESKFPDGIRRKLSGFKLQKSKADQGNENAEAVASRLSDEITEMLTAWRQTEEYKDLLDGGKAKKEAEEARIHALAVEKAKKIAAEEARKKAEEAELARVKAEEEERRVNELAEKKAQEKLEAQAKKKAEEEEAARKKAEEEAEQVRIKAEEEAAAKAKAEEEEAARKKAEEDEQARIKAEYEAAEAAKAKAAKDKYDGIVKNSALDTFLDF